MSLLGASFYRSRPAPKGVGVGHKVQVFLLPEGRGFVYELFDGKDNLIRRCADIYAAPGLAEIAGLEWLEEHKEYL
jgi:hypothetical protein